MECQTELIKSKQRCSHSHFAHEANDDEEKMFPLEMNPEGYFHEASHQMLSLEGFIQKIEEAVVIEGKQLYSILRSRY
eukprot:scaffold1882_cov163-Ochromonas_danica.AAC.7